MDIKRELQETIKPGGDKRSDEYLSSKNGGKIEGKESAEIAAEVVHVSRAFVYKAEKLLEAPDLAERVRAGCAVAQLGGSANWRMQSPIGDFFTGK